MNHQALTGGSSDNPRPQQGHPDAVGLNLAGWAQHSLLFPAPDPIQAPSVTNAGLPTRPLSLHVPTSPLSVYHSLLLAIAFLPEAGHHLSLFVTPTQRVLF